MDRVSVFIDSLFHANAIYDPVKAHEYYIRTRELTGRDPAAGKGSKGRENQRINEGVSYVKSKLGEQKKQELAVAAEDNKAQVAQIRQAAGDRRTEIHDKLAAVFAELSASSKEQAAGIAADAKQQLADIAAYRKDELAKIVEDTKQKTAALPQSLSKEERSDALAKIRGDAGDARDSVTAVVNQAKDDVRTQASGDKADLSGAVATEKKSQRDSSNSERAQLSSDVKDSIDSAKSSYESLKQNLKDKYEAKSLQEFQAVRNVGK